MGGELLCTEPTYCWFLSNVRDKKLMNGIVTPSEFVHLSILDLALSGVKGLIWGLKCPKKTGVNRVFFHAPYSILILSLVIHAMYYMPWKCCVATIPLVTEKVPDISILLHLLWFLATLFFLQSSP